jgi:hypothetical protein
LHCHFGGEFAGALGLAFETGRSFAILVAIFTGEIEEGRGKAKNPGGAEFVGRREE